MTAEARLILKRTARIERWQHSDHGDYNLDRLDREFREQLYSEEGRAILRSQGQAESTLTRKIDKK